jgi:hypothetical protein
VRVGVTRLNQLLLLPAHHDTASVFELCFRLFRSQAALTLFFLRERAQDRLKVVTLSQQPQQQQRSTLLEMDDNFQDTPTGPKLTKNSQKTSGLSNKRDQVYFSASHAQLLLLLRQQPRSLTSIRSRKTWSLSRYTTSLFHQNYQKLLCLKKSKNMYPTPLPLRDV